MIDLRIALNCINVQKENGTYHGARIGRIVQDCNGMVSGYRAGQIVLFKKEIDHEISSPHKPKYKGTLTIESPLSPEEIAREKRRPSLITTIGTMVGVPQGYVEEIRGGDLVLP